MSSLPRLKVSLSNISIPKVTDPSEGDNKIPKIPWKPRLFGDAEVMPGAEIKIDQVQAWFEKDRDGVTLRDRAAYQQGQKLMFAVRPFKLDEPISLRFMVVRQPQHNNEVEGPYQCKLRSPLIFPMDGKSPGSGDAFVERTKLLLDIIEEIKNTNGQRLILLRGDMCSGKTTFINTLKNNLDNNKDKIRTFFIRPLDLLELQRADPLGIWRILDQGIRHAYELSPRNVRAVNETEYRQNLSDDLLMKEEQIRNKVLVIVFDEVDRIAMNPPKYVAIADVLDKVINDLVMDVLRRRDLRVVVLLADWNKDITARCSRLSYSVMSFVKVININRFETQDIDALIEQVFGDLISGDSGRRWKQQNVKDISDLTKGNPLLVNALLEFCLVSWLNSSQAEQPMPINWAEATRYGRVKAAIEHLCTKTVVTTKRDPTGQVVQEDYRNRLSDEERTLLLKLSLPGTTPGAAIPVRPEEGTIVESLRQRGLVVREGNRARIGIPIIEMVLRQHRNLLTPRKGSREG